MDSIENNLEDFQQDTQYRFKILTEMTVANTENIEIIKSDVEFIKKFLCFFLIHFFQFEMPSYDIFFFSIVFFLIGVLAASFGASFLIIFVAVMLLAAVFC